MNKQRVYPWFSKRQMSLQPKLIEIFSLKCLSVYVNVAATLSICLSCKTLCVFFFFFKGGRSNSSGFVELNSVAAVVNRGNKQINSKTSLRWPQCAEVLEKNALVSESARCNGDKKKSTKQQASPKVWDCFTLLSRVCPRFLDRLAQSVLEKKKPWLSSESRF